MTNEGFSVNDFSDFCDNDPEFYTCRTRRLQSFHGAHSLTLQLVLTGAD